MAARYNAGDSSGDTNDVVDVIATLTPQHTEHAGCSLVVFQKTHCHRNEFFQPTLGQPGIQPEFGRQTRHIDVSEKAGNLRR